MTDGRVIVGIVERKRSISNTCVSVATYIARECAESAGYIVAASGIAIKRRRTVGGAPIAHGVTEECLIAGRGVLVAGGVAIECLETDGHIPDSAVQAKERVSSLRRVVANIASVWCWGR